MGGRRAALCGCLMMAGTDASPASDDSIDNRRTVLCVYQKKVTVIRQKLENREHRAAGKGKGEGKGKSDLRFLISVKNAVLKKAVCHENTRKNY